MMDIQVLDGDIGNSLPQDSQSEITPTKSQFPHGKALNQASVIALCFRGHNLVFT